MTKSNTMAATPIRELIDQRAQAVRTKDVDAMMATFSPDVVSFDVVDPLCYVGLEVVRQRTEEWFSSFDGPISAEMSELSISMGEEVAFSHRLVHVSGILHGGVRVDMWFRETECYRERGGAWLVTHQHSSVPFDTKTGKASLDLLP